jgi:hypothetical protein
MPRPPITIPQPTITPECQRTSRFFGVQGIESRRDSGGESPQDGISRYGQLVQGAVGHQQECAQKSEHERASFIEVRQFSQPNGHIQNDKHGAEKLKQCGCRGVAGLDGGKVGVLRAEHTENPKENELRAK